MHSTCNAGFCARVSSCYLLLARSPSCKHCTRFGLVGDGDRSQVFQVEPQRVHLSLSNENMSHVLKTRGLMKVSKGLSQLEIVADIRLSNS